MSHFVGSYVDEYVSAINASVLSGLPMIAIGKPGTGKTAIGLAALRQMFGDDKVVFCRIESTTPEEKVKGMVDYQKYLDTSTFEIKTDGTPYDPHIAGVLLDEIGRGNDVLWDTLLDVMDRQDIDRRDVPAIISTANFMPTSERTEAMRDRIALWYWLNGDSIDVSATVSAMMRSYTTGHKMTVAQKVPTAAEVHEVRHATPGDKAIKAVTDVIVRICQEAETGVPVGNDSGQANPDAGSSLVQFPINRRRIAQWQLIIFSYSMWLTGTNDFDHVPDAVIKVLKWAYPLENEKMARQWAEIAGAMGDPIQVAIDKMYREAYRVFAESYEANRSDRRRMTAVLGRHLGEVLANVRDLGIALDIPDDDVRLDEAANKLQELFARATQGENPFTEAI